MHDLRDRHRMTVSGARLTRTWLAGTLALGMLTTGGLVAFAPAASADASSRPPVAATGTRTVTAGPAELTIPAQWAVDDPAGCVRFDRQALYVGHADPKAVCSAQAVGRTEALQIEPLDASVTPAGTVPAMTLDQLVAAPARARIAASNEYEVKITDLNVLVTGSYANDPALIERVLASIRRAPHAQSWRTVSAAAVAGEYAAARATAKQHAAEAPRQANATAGSAANGSVLPHNVQAPFDGLGFDACTAPSISAMSAWLASWYRSVGIYIGGPARACGDGYLNSSWVQQSLSMGWMLIPIYVGRQAPCWPYYGAKIDPASATLQGSQDADDAVANMQRFGMGPGNPIYLDMEGYDNTNQSCSTAVRLYIVAWTAELHAKGYLSGVYSSAGSGIADLVSWYGPASPDDVWFADWNGQAILTDPVFPTTSYWPNHQRMHQFLGGHNETYGGYTINVDSNRVNSDVVGNPPRSVPSAPSGPPVQPLSPLPPTSDVYHPLPTTRVYDSLGNPLVANVDQQIKIAGLGGVPASGADAVVVNVEVQDPTASGYIRVTPGGYSSQTAVQEFAAGQTVSGVTQVRLGADGTIRLHLSAGVARIFVDVTGYYTSSGTQDTFHPMPNTRIFGTNTTQLVAGADQDIQVTGLGGVPTSGATAVLANVEVQNPTSGGYIRVTPGGTDSQTAVQEFSPGMTISNLTVVQLGANGTIRLHLSAGSATIFVDIEGYYSSDSSGDRYHPLTTARAYANLPLAAGADQNITLTGLAGVPASGVNSVTMNVEVQAPTQSGYIRVTPGGTDSQTAVQVFGANQTVSNLVTVKLDSQGRAHLHLSAGSAILFVDVVGYSAST